MKALLLVPAALLASACAAPIAEPAPTVTITEAPKPAPTVTITETPAPTVTITEAPASDATSNDDAITSAALSLAWADMSLAEQDEICEGYLYDPDLVWAIVAEDAAGVVTRDQFHTFFGQVC